MPYERFLTLGPSSLERPKQKQRNIMWQPVKGVTRHCVTLGQVENRLHLDLGYIRFIVSTNGPTQRYRDWPLMFLRFNECNFGRWLLVYCIANMHTVPPEKKPIKLAAGTSDKITRAQERPMTAAIFWTTTASRGTATGWPWPLRSKKPVFNEILRYSSRRYHIVYLFIPA